MPNPIKLRYFSPYEAIRVHYNRLPHWELSGGTYFVTFRLSDSLPHQLLSSWERERSAWLNQHPKPWSTDTETSYHTLFSGRKEQWLDQGYGSCALRDATVRGIVTKQVLAPKDTFHMWSAVFMPNHVHLLVTLEEDETIALVTKRWKGTTARTANKTRKTTGSPFWAKDYFDRLIRNEKHFANCVRYIQNNPRKAKLNSNEYSLFIDDAVTNY